MTEEKRKVLEMVRDGIITVEEGEELLRVLEETNQSENKDSKFKKKIKEDLNKTKEDLLKAKDRLVEEYEKIDFDKVKDKVKKGIDKVDETVRKVDKAILKFSDNLVNKLRKDKVEDEAEAEDLEEETLDPMNDDNISFYDKGGKE